MMSSVPFPLYILSALDMTAIQGYMSPSVFGSSAIFPGSDGNTGRNDNDFFKMFGHTSTTSRPGEPRGVDKDALNAAKIGNASRDEAGFFDFEPHTHPASPFRHQFSTPGSSGVPWSNDVNFQPLSPPMSATFSPQDWANYASENQRPGNILTNIDPINARTHYGQVTPPDDENDSQSLLDHQFSGQHSHIEPHQSESGPRKRKRNVGEQDSVHVKRTRKYASRGSLSIEDDGKPEDVKRSKFLERNRVAASKCRQKKKEWTQNLETRARELQKDNNMLRMTLESLRAELLSVKGEMLKHGSCDSHEIQQYIQSSANSLTDPNDGEVFFKRESHSPEPVYRLSESRDEERGSSTSSHGAEQCNASIMDDEDTFKALLSNSINDSTKDESAASKEDE